MRHLAITLWPDLDSDHRSVCLGRDIPTNLTQRLGGPHHEHLGVVGQSDVQGGAYGYRSPCRAAGRAACNQAFTRLPSRAARNRGRLVVGRSESKSPLFANCRADGRKSVVFRLTTVVHNGEPLGSQAEGMGSNGAKRTKSTTSRVHQGRRPCRSAAASRQQRSGNVSHYGGSCGASGWVHGSARVCDRRSRHIDRRRKAEEGRQTMCLQYENMAMAKCASRKPITRFLLHPAMRVRRCRKLTCHARHRSDADIS